MYKTNLYINSRKNARTQYYTLEYRANEKYWGASTRLLYFCNYIVLTQITHLVKEFYLNSDSKVCDILSIEAEN